MRILFLTVIPSPYQRQLFAALARDPDLSVAVRYFAGRADDREWDVPALASHERIMEGRTLSLLGLSAPWNPGVLNEIKSVKPDLVVISDYSAPTAQVAMRFLAHRGIPFVFWGEVPGFTRRGRVGSFLRGQLQSPLRNAAGIAAMGSVAVDAYRALFPGKPVFNIPYFCELEPFRTARALAERDLETIDILFSGQMIDRKGVDLLLDAFIRIAPDHPKLRLMLLGSGPKRDQIAAMVPTTLKSRVQFLGHREPSELPRIFAQADIFCLPSRHDGWGVVVNEALGAGLPLVLSDAVGAARDLLDHGRNGLLTASGDVSALAQGLAKLAGDQRLRDAMANSSSAAALRWDVYEGVRRWRETATSLLRGAPSP
jgi:glycosyltransferase involved in cell wall biosynthesis